MAGKYINFSDKNNEKISIKNLTKTFDEKILFRDFCINFPSNGIFAVTGKSGIGKTTLLRMISGLDKSFDGSIEVSGKISYVFQEYRLFENLTAIKNITEIVYEKSSEENIKTAENLLLKLGFTKEEMKLFPKELSGGMKQRVSIARAILSNTDIILMDEPTKELDFELSNNVIDVIKKEGQSRLIILVTHNSDDILKLSAEEIEIKEV